MRGMSADGKEPVCTLKLLVNATLAKAIIGKGGGAVQRIRAQSAVHSVHLSSHVPGAADRTCAILGPAPTVREAYRLIAALLRAEVGESGAEIVRIIVPRTLSLIGPTATMQLSRTSGASINAQHSSSACGPNEALITCTGSVSKVDAAVTSIIGSIARRHELRHRDFFAQWSFATEYGDHFETPARAFADIAPVLFAVAGENRRARLRNDQRRRDEHSEPACRSSDADPDADAVAELRIYDPYFCQGGMRAALAAELGCPLNNIINQNADFYAVAAAGRLPAHDVLVTNPPYSAEHKQRLLAHILREWELAADAGAGGSAAGERSSGEAASARPFLLLLPAWLAGTDYWRQFVRSSIGLCRGAGEQSGGSGVRRSRSSPEARAGIFYVAPRERYTFAHPQATGHATSPFHAVWFIGGWRTDAARRRAMASLKPLRYRGQVQVFRSAACLERHGYFAKRRGREDVEGARTADGDHGVDN